MLEVIKPYVIAWGRTVADFTRRTSGVENTVGNMQLIALPMQLGWASVSMRHEKPMKIAKDVAIIEADDCFQTVLDGPLMPEICRRCAIILQKAFAKFIDPNPSMCSPTMFVMAIIVAVRW